MKYLKIQKILSVIVSLCLIAETLTWNSLDVFAAEPSDVEAQSEIFTEDDSESISEELDGEVLTEDSDPEGLAEEKMEEQSDHSLDESGASETDSLGKEEEIAVPVTPGDEFGIPNSDQPEEETNSTDSEETEEVSDKEDPEVETEAVLSETEEAVELETKDIANEVEEVMDMEVSMLSGASQETYATSGNFANIILFVNFQDTDHSGHLSSSSSRCFMKDAEYTFNLFNGDAENPRGMRQYVSNISYGALEVSNIFPQYDEGTGQIVPYILKNNEEYYYGNDSDIIKEAVQQLNASGQLSADLAVDRDGDGAVDNLTIVVPCEKSGKGDKFNGHKSNYGGDVRINGKRVSPYNVIPEYTVYRGLNGSGVIIHEFLHTVGYPDLYRGSATASTGYPVGGWDIMANAGWYVQYPLAYLRGVVTCWFEIPEVKESVQGMSLYAASRASFENKDQQAVILKTEYSNTEFFVLEYRKQENSNNITDYDYKIPGSGLIIYRVNLASSTNIAGDKDMIYVFRPGDSYNDNHLELAGGDLSTSFLSAESGRTSYGTHDPGKSLSDGAITYSDGTNSGIVISNVGSAGGDQITFDITYAAEDRDYWQNVSVQGKEDRSFEIASYMDTDGTLYYLQRKNNPGSGPVYLYTCTSEGWKRCSSALPGNGYWYHLEKYNGSIYSGYVENMKVKLVRWTGSTWEAVYTSAEAAGEFDMTADADGICLAYTGNDSTKLYACRYDGINIRTLGEQVAEASNIPGLKWTNTISNPSITVEDGKIAVMYREVHNSNQVFVRLYDDVDHIWKAVGERSFSANSGMVRIHRNKLYMLKNGEEFGKNESYLYVYDLSQPNREWTMVGDGFYLNESVVEMSLVFQGDTPYIACYGGASQMVYVMSLESGKWISLGKRVTNETLSGLAAYLYDGKIYVTYLSTVDDRVYIKSHSAGHRYEAVVTRKADCNTEGIMTYTCVDCQDTYTETIAKLGSHEYGQWVTTSASTCKQEGEKTRTCSVCGKTESVSIAKSTTHKYGQWSTTVASTCQKEGKKARTCTVCGITESAVVAKNAHIAGDTATCTKAQTCKVCKTVLKKAAGHRNIQTEKTAATFLKTGLTKTVCKDCGVVISKKTLSKVSCKKGQVYTVGSYKYKIISPKTNGTGTVSFEGLAKSVTCVTIRNTVTILGVKFKVVQISNKALKNKTKVTSVTVGSNVQTIGKEAFYGMKKLKTLTIKSTKITKAGSNALKNIHAKARIKVPKSKFKKYQKLFKGKGQKSTVKIIY